MATVYFVTHPEVVIDPAIPIPDWPLSATGLSRINSFCERPEISRLSDVYVSSERKAIDCAVAMKEKRQLDYKIVPELGENDRSATGFLEPPRFWEVVTLFFDNPEKSILGWERAIDAQRRIVESVANCIQDRAGGGDICIFSHGGVGSLLLSHLMGESISRQQGQPLAGGGCYFAFDAETHALLHGWRDIAP